MTKRILYLGLDPSRYPDQGTITHWPIIKIIPRSICEPVIQGALCLFEHYTHVLITSKSTVDILSDFLLQLGIPMNAWKKKITLAVGQGTAARLQAVGVSPAVIAEEETAEGMIAELKKMMMNDPQWIHNGTYIFWPHSSQSRSILKDFLSENGIRHVACELYDPQLNVPGELPILESFDEIVFTSPSTVNAFLEIFGTFPLHAKLIPIGPITEKALGSVQQ